MFPIKSDDVRVGFPFVTISLILLCIGAQISRGYYAQYAGGLVPVDLLYALFHPDKDLGTALITLVFAYFLHAGITHLVFNMWYLWIFGGALESYVGTLPFFLTYMICGVLSLLCQSLSTPTSLVPIIGASGAIAGIMGAFLVMLPLSRILMWFPPLFFFRVPAFLFLLAWAGMQYFNMTRIGAANSGVAWWAHIGGFAAGVIAGFILKKGTAVPRRASAPASPLRKGRHR